MKKIILNIGLMLLVLFIGITNVKAASYTISVGSQGITKGGSTKLTIRGSDVTGRFNISSSNPSVVSISDDRAWIENDSYSINLSALNVGSATITVTPNGVSDSNGNSVALGAKSVKITVSLPREKSNDNNLKSLTVEGYELTPAFNKDTLEYSTNVPEGITSANIIANAADRYASISGAGVVNLTEGANSFNIVVKSETGKEKIYKVTINVIDESPIDVTVDGANYTVIKLRSNYTCPELFTESEVNINDIAIPACYNDKLNYTLVGLKKEDGTVENFIYDNGKYEKYNEIVATSLKLIILDSTEELEGLIKTTVEIDGIKYSAFKTSENSKLYVVYGIDIESGKKDFYVYDSLNKTFVKYERMNDNNLKDLNQTYLYVIIAFGISLFLAIICIIKLNATKQKLKNKLLGKESPKKKKKNEQKDSFPKEDIESLMEVIQSDDEVVEENSKKNKKK